MKRVALLASVFVHATFLGLAWLVLPSQSHQGVRSSYVPLTVDIVEAQATAKQEPVPFAVPKRRQQPTSDSSDVVETSNAEVASANTSPPAYAAISTAQSSTTHAHSKAADSPAMAPNCWQSVDALLQERVSKELPRSVRQRGFTGRVVVTFELGSQGVLSHVQVVQSSGHPLLDDAVRRLLETPLQTTCAGRGRWPIVFRR